MRFVDIMLTFFFNKYLLFLKEYNILKRPSKYNRRKIDLRLNEDIQIVSLASYMVLVLTVIY